MKILVTGASGFLGFHLCKSLLLDDHDVYGIDNFMGSTEENASELETIGIEDGKGYFHFEEADCTNLAHMKAIMEHVRPDVIYHLACFPHEGLSVCSPYKITESVTMGTMAVLSAAAQTGVKRFIYTSSMARYGSQPSVPFLETAIPLPQDPYGWAKYAAEGQVRAVCEAFGIEYVIAVPHNIYGTHQKYDDPFRNVAAIMCNRILQNKQPIIYGDGKQMRCFSYVEDLIPAFKLLATDPNINGHVVNLGPEWPFITINELATMLCRIAGMPCDPIYMADRPREVKHANCSAEKAKRMLNVVFQTDLVCGMTKLFNWIKKKGPKEFTYHLPIEINHNNTPKVWKDRAHNK